MSYDINLVKDHKEIYDDNYTYNVGNMFRDALGGNGLYELHEKLANDCIDLLKKAVITMKDNPEHYKEMNPENGWGNYEGAMSVLERLYNACIEESDSLIIIS